MAKKTTTTKSYLLRLEPEDNNGRQRIHFQEVGKVTNVRHFADIDHFIDYLLTVLSACEKAKRPCGSPTVRSKK